MRWCREQRVLKTGRDRLGGEEGQALVEYALILGVVAVLTIGVLQALGVSEMAPLPLEEPEQRVERDAAPHLDAVDAVTEHTVRIASERGARGVATTDVLMAVMHVYGEDFDRVLRAHGTDRDEVLERLGSWEPEKPLR